MQVSKYNYCTRITESKARWFRDAHEKITHENFVIILKNNNNYYYSQFFYMFKTEATKAVSVTLEMKKNLCQCFETIWRLTQKCCVPISHQQLQPSETTLNLTG